MQALRLSNQFIASDLMWSTDLNKRIRALEAKQRELEGLLEKVLPSPRQNEIAGDLDRGLRGLAQRVVGDHPQMSYFNERLRTYEFAILNIKQLGFELGRMLADTNLQREVKSPPSTVLKSSLCVQSDIESDWFAFWCREMKVAPIYHRKLWELCYICQAIWTAGKFAPGLTGLGFGCGNEPLPSVFAKYGAYPLATDLDPSRPEAKDWRETSQHGDSVEGFRNRDICADEQLLRNITYRPVDMNDIPYDLDGRFDFCWSSCALEHLGSIEKGLAFMENSLRTLKPGGVAVHTTEFNLEDGDTIDNWGTVLFQKRHFVEFGGRLRSRGFQVAPLEFNPGDQILDGFVDIPPWGHDAVRLSSPAAHLKLCVDGFPCTSIGLIIQAPQAD